MLVLLACARMGKDVHPGELGRSAAGNLLRAELDELLLEVVELDLEVVLVLAPEGCGLDLCGRLSEIARQPCPCANLEISHGEDAGSRTILCCWWSKN